MVTKRVSGTSNRRKKARDQCDQALYGTATRATESRSTQPQKGACPLLLAAALAGYGPSLCQKWYVRTLPSGG